MSKALRLLGASPGRQSLVRLCQSINYGQIRNLAVQDGEPIFSSPPLLVLADVRLDLEDQKRDEVSLDDFLLCSEFCRVMLILDEIGTGTISSIEVRGGVPRKITFEKRLLKLPVTRQAGSKDPVRRCWLKETAARRLRATSGTRGDGSVRKDARPKGIPGNHARWGLSRFDRAGGQKRQLLQVRQNPHEVGVT